MPLTIGNNHVQLTLFQNNAKANRFTNQATTRLATGLRINQGSDDPAGLIAAEQLRGDLVEIGAQVKIINAQRRNNSVQESGRRIATDVLHELRGLFLEADDGSLSDDERKAIQLQVDSSLDGLEFLGEATGFGLPASLEALRAGGEANAADGDAAAGVELLDAELSSLNLARVAAGAYEKYTLDVDQRLAEDRAVATASALSQIADADYVRESSNQVKGQILTEASIKTLALSQQLRAQQVLSLLELI